MRLHPHQDPEFRRLLALDGKDQIALLNAMAGIVPAARPRVSMFRPVPLDVIRTPRTVCYRPTSFPSAVTTQDDDHVTIAIEHVWCRSVHQARSPKGIAALDAIAAAIIPRRGILRLPFTARVPWTERTIGAVIRAMVLNLPDVPSDPSDVNVWLRDQMDQDPEGVRIGACARGSQFFSEVILKRQGHGGTPWGKFWWNHSGTLGQLETWIAKEPQEVQAYKGDEPNAGAARRDDNDGYAGLDDDLDAFEKAARRRLHGEGGLTPINRRGERFDGESLDELQTTFEAIDRSLQETVKAIDRSLRETAKVLEDVGKMLIEGGGKQ